MEREGQKVPTYIFRQFQEFVEFRDKLNEQFPLVTWPNFSTRFDYESLYIYIFLAKLTELLPENKFKLSLLKYTVSTVIALFILWTDCFLKGMGYEPQQYETELFRKHLVNESYAADHFKGHSIQAVSCIKFLEKGMIDYMKPLSMIF